MSSINTLYRKYRPKKFNELIGQEIVAKSLVNSIINNNTSQAYIFSGTRGTGKTTIAKILAKAINCLNFKEDICLECDNCKLISEDKTIDIVELDAASNNGVEYVRNIIDNAKYLPQNLKTKVFIIDEAHMLSNSAWNAFLKTIEEPPKHCIFIFATTEYHKIPTTIISRCVRYQFNKLSKTNLNELIKFVSKKEDIKISPEAIEKISYLADGAARDALTILEQLKSFTDNQITISDISKVFGLLDNSSIINFLNYYFDDDSQKIFESLKSFSNIENHSYLINTLVEYCIDLISYLKTNNLDLLCFLTLTEIKKIHNYTLEKLKRLLDVLNQTLKEAKFNNKYFFYFKMNFMSLLDDSILNIQTDQKTKEPIFQDSKQESISNDSKTNSNKMYKDVYIDSNVNLKDFYDLNTIKKSEKLTKEIEQKNNNSNLYELFEKTILNISKQETLNAQEYLKKLSNDIHTENILKLLSNAKKALAYSNKLCFICFDDTYQSKTFNDLFLENKNNEIINKSFESEIYFIAIDKNTAKQYIESAKKSKQENKKVIPITFKDINDFFGFEDEDDIINDIKNL